MTLVNSCEAILYLLDSTRPWEPLVLIVEITVAMGIDCGWIPLGDWEETVQRSSDARAKVIC